MDVWESFNIRLLVWSRFFVFFLQFFANFLLPDHDADAFRTLDLNKKTFLDDSIQILLGGFFRWDSQHFVHIARFGYTFENNLAFYPRPQNLKKNSKKFQKFNKNTVTHKLFCEFSKFFFKFAGEFEKFKKIRKFFLKFNRNLKIG